MRSRIGDMLKDKHGENEIIIILLNRLNIPDPNPIGLLVEPLGVVRGHVLGMVRYPGQGLLIDIFAEKLSEFAAPRPHFEDPHFPALLQSSPDTFQEQVPAADLPVGLGKSDVIKRFSVVIVKLLTKPVDRRLGSWVLRIERKHVAFQLWAARSLRQAESPAPSLLESAQRSHPEHPARWSLLHCGEALWSTFMIIPPVPATPASVGGKGLALIKAREGGFPVPPFCILTPGSVPDNWSPNRAEEGLSESEQAAIRVLYEGSLPGAATFAVRSSAIDEDGASHSFAGQLESYLYVDPVDLPRRIAAVWQSAFQERVLAYRKNLGLSTPPQWPAVIIQVMIQPRAAGVAFSVDPLHPESGARTVAAVPGDGEKLVSGETDAITWQIADDDSIGTPHRPAGIDLDLPPAVLLEIAALATRCAEFFGAPQDIEWAWDGTTVFLLQSRPITTLPSSPEPGDGESTLTIWDNSNIAESYQGITTALTFSFARSIYAEVYQEFCRFLRVPTARIAASRLVFAQMLGLIRGRVYYQLLNWYRLIAMLPGFRLNRGFMEQMMGVKESLPPALAEQIQAEYRGSRWRDALALTRTSLALIGQWITLKGRIRRFHQRLEEALAETENLPLAKATALAASYRTLEDRLLRRWDAPLINDFFTMIAFGLLRFFCRQIDPEDGETRANHLVAGEGTMISIEPSRRVREIAALVAPHPGLQKTFLTGDRETVRREMADFPLVQKAVEEYLERFGQRCLEELKLESLPLTVAPEPLFRSIGALAGKIASTPAAAEINRAAESRREADAFMQTKLQGHPLRRWRYHMLVKAATRRIADRENLRYERTRLFGRVRSIFLALGEILAREKVLSESRDIFYLTVEEVLGFVEGTAPNYDLGPLAQHRKEEFARYREEPEPPGRIRWEGAVGHYRPIEEETSSIPEGDHWQGMGCCPGRVRGVVRVIRDPTRTTIEPGEILVASRTDPGWVMLFPLASAVLVEHGSLLSHSAIVAREMGIPAIVSIPGLLNALKTGDVVEMDGRDGWIKRLPPTETSPT